MRSIQVFLLLFCASAVAAERPNIVLILADDMGWADLGCYGADLHETPQLDRLASEGVRFTIAYAMPVCSPTRAALMTGRHAARVHMTIWSEGALKGPTNRKLLQADSLHSLPHTESTLAKHLQDAGYITALVGKQPGKATELRERLHRWRRETGAAMPKPNPDFKPRSGASR